MEIDETYSESAGNEDKFVVKQRNRLILIKEKDNIAAWLKQGYYLKAIYLHLKKTKNLSVAYSSFAQFVQLKITHGSVSNFVIGYQSEMVGKTAANSNGQSAPAPVKTSAPVTPVAGTVGGNGTKTVIPAMNRFPSLKEREEMRRQAEQAAAAQNGQKPKQEQELKLPSFDNWDGDSRKYIKQLIGD